MTLLLKNSYHISIKIILILTKIIINNTFLLWKNKKIKKYAKKYLILV